LAASIATAAGVALGFVGSGSNDCGAWMAGALPHRAVGGAAPSTVGLNAREMLEQPRELYLTVGFEPEMDTADPALATAALGAGRVIALASHASPWLLEHADILLPVAAFAETSGTLVNVEGVAQSFQGVAAPQGEARPAWKVLRVLGNLTDIEGFDYVDSTDVRDEVIAACSALRPDNTVGELGPVQAEAAAGAWERIGGVPMYAADALTRHAQALQATPDAWGDGVRLNTTAAHALGVDGSSTLRVTQGDAHADLSVRIDDAVPDGCVWLPTAVPGSETLGPCFGPVSVEKV
jgi:NADH-quinone oxidoreductase subunit G